MALTIKKPRIVSVKENNPAEKEPPSRKEYNFVFEHVPGKKK